jgi:Polyketide cyclase / dehydrase and lipid transport
MSSSGVPVTVEATAAAVPEAVFDVIVPIALPEIFTGFGPLPAVIGTRDQTGAWDHVGAERAIDLADGSTAREEITAHARPTYFAYRVSEFSSALGRLVHGARGEWWFEPAGGGTAIRWRYTFEPRTGARPLVAVVIARLWRGYARRALALAVARAERAADPPASAT